MSEIKQFPKMRVAYVTEVGPYGEAVQRGFGRLFAWVGANNVQPLGPSLGIYYDDPAQVAPEQLRCDLAVPVAPEVTGSGEVAVKEIGGFEVAALVYQGEQNIMPAYDEVYNWLRAQGYREAGVPMETYLSYPGEELCAEVAVPVKKVVKRAAKKPVKKVAKKPAKKPAKKTAKKRGK
jgi:DNA gyrase inhibitor GyrI